MEHNGPGKPPFFSNPIELENKITAYFDSCKYQVIPAKEEGEAAEIVYAQPFTITGLAYFLGFESRQSFYDYEKHEEYSYIIKRARLMIESEYEKKLSYKHPVGSIFALKNMGWKDESMVNLNDARKAVADVFPWNQPEEGEVDENQSKV
jgi:hypothetical protein